MIGAFYLTEKEGADDFSATDQEVIELLAAHAAIAITNARLYERSRELSILAERNRLALELHDAVSQKLFSLVLTAEAAGTLLDRDADAVAARAQVAEVQESARAALDELRSLIFELRPPDLARDGLCGALRKHVEVVRPCCPRRSSSTSRPTWTRSPHATGRFCASPRRRSHNALRHAEAEHVWVRLGAGGRPARARGP